MEKLIENWGKKNPEWEIKYEDTIIKRYTDYGRGAGKLGEDKGKIYGAGYEIYIVAFFIGLYFDKRKPLVTDKSKRKGFGQPIMYWGNGEVRNLRSQYGSIRNYIFAALVAKTDVDLIALDKGEVSDKEIVAQLITTMEEYANYGFAYMSEMLEDNPNYFFKEGAFLYMFLQFITEEKNDEDDAPESLD